MKPERFDAIMRNLWGGKALGANRRELELIVRNLAIPAQAFYDHTQKGEGVVWLTREEVFEIAQAMIMAQGAANERIEQGGHEAIKKAIALLKPKRLTTPEGSLH